MDHDRINRMRSELDGLTARIERIDAFYNSAAFSKTHIAEQERIVRQHAAMRAYADVLAERIAFAESPPPKPLDCYHQSLGESVDRKFAMGSHGA
jgi:hypothetical protein